MMSWRNAWGVALLCAVIALCAAPAALGQSAGNQQYVDPLANTTPTAPAATGSPPPPAPNSSPVPSAPAAGSSSSASGSGDAATVTTSASSGATAHSASGTLPFTGLDLWPAVAIGVGLVGMGIVIRRVARRA